MRFQVFCFLIGSIAFISVRRQKAQHASLFDQRGRRQPRRLNDQNNMSIELATTSAPSSQTNEMKSLTEHDERAANSKVNNSAADIV
jgi:hypothetical protein